jgi:hypothetical protein
MAALSTQKPSTAGVALTPVAAGASGDTFKNTGREIFYVVNDSGADVDVTFSAGDANANICSFGVAHAGHALVIPVPAGGNAMVGPFDKARFNDADNNINVSYEATTSVTVAAIAQI